MDRGGTHIDLFLPSSNFRNADNLQEERTDLPQGTKPAPGQGSER